MDVQDRISLPADRLFGYTAWDAKHGEALLVFRGTLDPDWSADGAFKNIVTDLDATQVKFFKHEAVLVHEGFFRGYEKMRTAVLAAVKTLRAAHKDAPLVLSGHSLGAALASVAAADFAMNHKMENLRLVTFGSPRVFNKKGAQTVTNALLRKVWRVVHRHDPVPHMPLCTKGGCNEAGNGKTGFPGLLHDVISTVSGWITGGTSFWHVAKEVWQPDGCSTYHACDSAKAYKLCDMTGEDPTCSDSVTPDHYDPNDHVNGYCGIRPEGLLDDKVVCPKAMVTSPD